MCAAQLRGMIAFVALPGGLHPFCRGSDRHPSQAQPSQAQPPAVAMSQEMALASQVSPHGSGSQAVAMLQERLSQPWDPSRGLALNFRLEKTDFYAPWDLDEKLLDGDALGVGGWRPPFVKPGEAVYTTLRGWLIGEVFLDADRVRQLDGGVRDTKALYDPSESVALSEPMVAHPDLWRGYIPFKFRTAGSACAIKHYKMAAANIQCKHDRAAKRARYDAAESAAESAQGVWKLMGGPVELMVVGIPPKTFLQGIITGAIFIDKKNDGIHFTEPLCDENYPNVVLVRHALSRFVGSLKAGSLTDAPRLPISGAADSADGGDENETERASHCTARNPFSARASSASFVVEDGTQIIVDESMIVVQETAQTLLDVGVDDTVV